MIYVLKHMPKYTVTHFIKMHMLLFLFFVCVCLQDTYLKMILLTHFWYTYMHTNTSRIVSPLCFCDNRENIR